MASPKIRHVCQECGYESLKWIGRCPSCGQWQSFVEVVVVRGATGNFRTRVGEPQRLTDVDTGEAPRIQTGLGELDRIMGGGIMRGSITLIAGDPGIGKSTLMTELGKFLRPLNVLYVTGEESARQVRLRAERLNAATPNVLVFAETNLEEILASTMEVDPDVLIIDSIQTVYRPDVHSAPGSVSQIRECASSLMRVTKEFNVATFLVGHVTKTGAIAGPRVLEHMVDTVVTFEGDRHHETRVLRAVKNRFGSTNELGVFAMSGNGLQEITNPSAVFLSERHAAASGSVVICTMEGTRPLLVEVQALVSPTWYGTPQRTTTGFDLRRLQLLVAVLEKREGLGLGAHDIFLNVAGGARLDEPAADLGVVMAIASSLRDVPSDKHGVLIGEVGLGGEVRGVSKLELRLRESAKLGFGSAIVPGNSLDGLSPPVSMEVAGVDTLAEALDLLG